MLEHIYNLFRERARKHLLIKSFHYTRTYNLGSGKDFYPAFVLEQDLSGNNSGQNGSIITNLCNFSILILPKETDNIIQLQNLAFSAGLNIIESIKQDKDCLFTIAPDWSYLTLVDYYDDDSVGCRFSLNLVSRNMENLCLLPEHFSDDKEFEKQIGINEFALNPQSKCETYTNKPLQFNLPTKKKQ
ncbi:hypothetical protein EZS27_018396 [termite gut metagenome]|uniref:Uncharacterized protein n=1 Tax=termite gut metagenome TaxID=433724 RepID=A0A5J4RHK3_9ZZZZ